MLTPVLVALRIVADSWSRIPAFCAWWTMRGVVQWDMVPPMIPGARKIVRYAISA